MVIVLWVIAGIIGIIDLILIVGLIQTIRINR